MAADAAVRGGRAAPPADAATAPGGGASYLAGPVRSFTSEPEDEAVTIR